MDPLHYVLENTLTDDRYPGLYSLIVYQRDQLMYERYFLNHDPASLFDIRSSFKSILSLLIGIASDRNYFHSIDDKIFPYFANTRYAGLLEGAKGEITIRDLLTMRSGLICEEFFSSHDCETPMEESDEWVTYCMQVPMVHKPGTHWSYSTCNTLIAGALMEAATGMPLSSFAIEYLFDPLGISDYRWTRDPSGNYMPGGSFFMRTADMLKIGQLVLQDGYYRNKLIISSRYLNMATAAITPIPSFSFVAESGMKRAHPKPACYGFYWYSEVIKAGKRHYTCQFSSGNGGQYILVIKELALVVVCTQGNFDSRKAKQFFEILVKHILPIVDP